MLKRVFFILINIVYFDKIKFSDKLILDNWIKIWEIVV